MKLQDCKVLVTGGASGMGRHFTLALAAAGADVAFCDLNPDGIAEVEAAGADLPGKVKGFEANVASEESVVALVKGAREALGGLNVLVNNAGIFRDGMLVRKDRTTGEVKTMSLKKWQSVIDVDLTGPFLCTREFAAGVVEAGDKDAVIVNISSVARHGNRGQTNYSAAKAGLIADTKLWALELSRYGIRTGAVAPGFVDTPILQGMKPEVLQSMLKAVPLRRAAITGQIARDHLPTGHTIPFGGVRKGFLEGRSLGRERQNQTGENQSGELHAPMTPQGAPFGKQITRSATPQPDRGGRRGWRGSPRPRRPRPWWPTATRATATAASRTVWRLREYPAILQQHKYCPASRE